MKKFRLDYKKFVAVLFVAFIIGSGAITIALNPIKVFGGLARGYMDSPKDTNVLEKIGNSFSEFDRRMNEYYVLHDQSINTYGFIQRILGVTLIDDVDPSYEVLKLKNGYLVFKDTHFHDYSDLNSYLLKLNKTCKKSGTDFLYVNKVSKDTDDRDLLPDNYPYIFSSNYDELEKSLLSNGINVLNIDSIIKDKKIDKYSLFFKTDHHWTPKTGVWVSQLISNRLNEKFNYKLDSNLFDIDNYNIDTYENSFLGSQGKRVGFAYVGVDNFDVITPKYKTNLELRIPSENIKIKGDFEDTMIHRESITPDNLLNKDDTAYDTYMKGNHALVNIKNNQIKNGKKALLVLDSYGCVVAPYLSQVFTNLDCIDLRSFTGSLEEYIVKTKPDVVIYMESIPQ